MAELNDHPKGLFAVDLWQMLDNKSMCKALARLDSFTAISDSREGKNLEKCFPAQAKKALQHQNKRRYSALPVQIWLYEGWYTAGQGDTCLRGWGKKDDLWAYKCLACNDKYEINIVTLICPKHNCDVVHSVSIKGGIKRWCLRVVRARRPCPFEPWRSRRAWQP